MPAEPTDPQLLDQWRGGDATAGRALFERHFDAVKRFFRNKVATGVEDLVQKTFLVCVETRDAVREGSTFRGFVLGVAHNVLRNHLRSKRRKDGPIDFGTVSAAALDPTPSRWVAVRQEQQAILIALRQIPLQCQVVLELYYWEQMDRNAIAAALGIPAGTAASRLRRGREMLAEELSRVADSPALLQRTLSSLEDWAAQLAADVRSDAVSS